MIRGLDASSVQGLIPFGSLDPSIRFAILKAQEGNDGFDPLFARNMRGALKAGLHAYAYVFAYPIQNNGPMTSGYRYGRDPREQAKLCVDRVHAFPEMRGLPIFADLEWPEPTKWKDWGLTARSISEWCRVFCEEVALLSGAQPILYTYPHWWQSLSAADVSWASRYALWLASYPERNRWPTEAERPPVPKPWNDWLFWQFDGNGGMTLPSGVDSDFCVFNGDEDALAALRMPVTLPPPAPANDNEPATIDGGTVHPRVIWDDEPEPPDAA